MKSIKLIIVFLFFCATLVAQDDTDLMKQLEKDSNKTNYTTATFKSTRLITGHTIETLGKGILDVRILHRFAPINRGLYDFFGLDYASMRLGFDYGITNNIMIGIGRSTWQKTYDALFKIKILKQSTGAVNMPVTLTFVSTFATRSDLARKDTLNNRILINFADRTSFSEQLIVSRKFSNNFSLQFMPIFIFNHNKIDSIRFNNLSLGVDIETGGHIFQMHFTNANGMTEKSFITDTDDKWRDGYIRFGFNISRVFKVGKP